MRVLVALFLGILFLGCETTTEEKVADFPTHFENSEGTETATYLQIIDFYIRLAKEFPEINFQTIGETDSGQPLHIVTYNPDSDFNFNKIGTEKTIVLINNGIHPGESDGIDATMMLYRDFATGKLDPPKNTVLVSIPVYNIGGALNRNSETRVNQNGPVSYGFRGNAKNYDLNRDFMKADSKNALSFMEIFHLTKPDIFVDNHVSNGADYQYTLTHLFTQHNKMGGTLGQYLHKQLMPTLENALADQSWDITPYVNVFNTVPEKGFSQFMDHPRYSTGYTTLWNTLGLMVETHMLKPYKQRVAGTYELMKQLIAIAEKDGDTIKTLREKAFSDYRAQKYYPLQWAIDTTRSSTINFKGYMADTLVSEVTGLPRLKYDRKRPFEKPVTYRNHMRPTDSVPIPKAYIIKKGYENIIDLLEQNQIEYRQIRNDSALVVESYKIKEYKTYTEAYEGHYPHYGTKVSKETIKVLFSEGDYLVLTDQPGIRYVLESLEPIAMDSFFNWNFFDTILQQKEDFSPYVFEEVAAKLLKSDQNLREAFLEKKNNDPEFESDWYAQLEWVYHRSVHYEKAHLQYPVYRIPKD
ncbi:M14 family metallopeptidase [Maribacter sp. 2-571]|uniref:M14 family metallopeptidase n=1 Tax=Maribacter sp. 2-571 TaxID=3417569 RepID=UPI003D3305CC